MAAPFDPYHKWLGIPPAQQPPTHYRLLGLELFESDPDVIDAAANRQMAYLQDLAVGDRVAESQKLLNEVSTARRTLLNKEKKADYDATLKSAAPAPAVVEEAPAEEANPFATESAFAADPTPSARGRVKKVAAPAPGDAPAHSPMKRTPLLIAAGVIGVLGVAGAAFKLLNPGKAPTTELIEVRPNAKADPKGRPTPAKGPSPAELLPKAAHLTAELPLARWQPSPPVEAGGKWHVFALLPGMDGTDVQPYSSADALKWEPGEKSSLPGTLHHPAVVVDADDAAKLGKGRLLLFATASDGGKPALKLFQSGDGKAWAPVEASGVELPAGPDVPAARPAWNPEAKRFWVTAGAVEADSGGLFPVFASADLKKWSKAGDVELPAFSGVPSFVRVPGEKPDTFATWVVTSAGKAYPLPPVKGKIVPDAKREQFLDAGTFGARSESGWQPVRLAAAGGTLLGGAADTVTSRDAGATVSLLPTSLREAGGKLARQLPAPLAKKLDAVKATPHDVKKPELLPGPPAPAFALALDAELDKGGRLDVVLGGVSLQFFADDRNLKLGRSRNFEGAVSDEGGKKRVRATLVSDGAWLLLLADGGRFSWSGPTPRPAVPGEPNVGGEKVKSLAVKYAAP